LKITSTEFYILNLIYDDVFPQWKKNIVILYGEEYAEKFCTLETYKQHCEAMGYLKQFKKQEKETIKHIIEGAEK
jgi:hypothetical protein